MAPDPLAKFSVSKSLFLTAIILGMGAWLWLRPFELSRSPVDVALHSRWGLVWAFASIGYVYLYWIIILMLVRILFFSSSAIYIVNNKLVYIFPIIFSTKLNDIEEIAYTPRTGPFRSSGSIFLSLKNGKMKSLKTDIFKDNPSDVVKKIKLLKALGSRSI